jgi:hypothetical protein
MLFGRRKPVKIDRQIFISYRRADSARLAGLLHDRLAASFDGTRVFMDLHTIFPGDDFPEEIARALKDTDVFLALIGPGWEPMR